MISFVAAERFGRKGSIMWGCIIMVVGTILQTTAMEKIQMILSRIITGIGNGINTCAVPMWQAESFKSHNRGVSKPAVLLHLLVFFLVFFHHHHHHHLILLLSLLLLFSLFPLSFFPP